MFARVGVALSAFVFALIIASGGGTHLHAGAKAVLKSGPAVGSTVPSLLTVNVTGPWKGQRISLVEAYGQQPVALILARKLTEPVAALVTKLDAMAGEKKFRIVAVILTEDDNAEARLTKLAETEKLKNSVLAVDGPAGPKDFSLSPNA